MTHYGKNGFCKQQNKTPTFVKKIGVDKNRLYGVQLKNAVTFFLEGFAV